MLERPPMPVYLVTGATGFLGRPLLEALLGSEDSGCRILTVGRRCPAGWPADSFIPADLTNSQCVRAAIAQAGASVVFHLAGRTPPATPGELYASNSVATAQLLDALREQGRPVRVVLAGSAAELGPVDERDLPVDEGHPCRPDTPYGLSKWLASCAGLAARPPLEVMVARIFNPIGPGTPESQSLGRFAARLSDPNPGELKVGRLDTRRDFVDVRDVARALIALGRQGHAGLIYHVGTGGSQRVGDGLERLHRLSGERVRITIDPERAADSGPGDSRADIRRLVGHTGWQPRISWEQSLEDLWNEARTRPRLPLTV